MKSAHVVSEALQNNQQQKRWGGSEKNLGVEARLEAQGQSDQVIGMGAGRGKLVKGARNKN